MMCWVGLHQLYIVSMKILYQSLWKKKLGWPDDETIRLHKEWRQQLSLLSNVTLPRCYFAPGKVITVQLHGFSDASAQAYAAVIYIRVTYEDGSATSRLEVAKTKVAPLNTISIPRLELCGAVLLAELLDLTGTTLNISKDMVRQHCGTGLAQRVSQQIQGVCWEQNCLCSQKPASLSMEACTYPPEPCRLCIQRSDSSGAQRSSSLVEWTTMAGTGTSRDSSTTSVLRLG